MSRLPVIVGFGGFNAAGRSSFHHGYRRMVIESLPEKIREETLVGLATLMKLVTYSESQYVDADGNALDPHEVAAKFSQQILDSTLIRRIEEFDDTATKKLIWRQALVHLSHSLCRSNNCRNLCRCRGRCLCPQSRRRALWHRSLLRQVSVA